MLFISPSKKSPYETVKVLQKNSNLIFGWRGNNLDAPQDTAELKFGSYWYDIQVTFSNGTVKNACATINF